MYKQVDNNQPEKESHVAPSDSCQMGTTSLSSIPRYSNKYNSGVLKQGAVSALFLPVSLSGDDQMASVGTLLPDNHVQSPRSAVTVVTVVGATGLVL